MDDHRRRIHPPRLLFQEMVVVGLYCNHQLNEEGTYSDFAFAVLLTLRKRTSFLRVLGGCLDGMTQTRRSYFSGTCGVGSIKHDLPTLSAL